MATRRHALALFLATGLSSGLVVPCAVFADTIDGIAMTEFAKGNWKQAAQIAARLHDADNLAFAARSLLASALLSSPSRTRGRDVSQARTYAQAALILAPKHIEGRLQMATALGLQARTGSPVKAFTLGLPQRIRRLLDSVARDDPSQAWAFALLGGWHLEALRIGGAGARAMLGVNLAAGKQAFARAMTLDGSIAATPFYFAASLLALAPGENKGEARTLLVRAQSTPKRDAFQDEVQARAAQLLAILDQKGPEAAANQALKWL